MPQFWRAPVGNTPGVGAGTQLSGSTSLTDVSPAPQIVLPANYLFVGQRLRFTSYGIFTSAASTPGTLLIGVYYGGVAGTLLASGGANNLPTSAASWLFNLYLDIFVRSTGSSGTVWCNGELKVYQSLGGGGTAPLIYAMPTTQTQPVTINTTTANAITTGAQFSSSVTNTLTCEDAYLETIG